MNSSQNRVSRRHARTGVAALSAITLALGSLSIFSHGDLAPEATDLPAGSCVVQADNSQQGSQAGFSWYTSEPSASSPNKTRWGLSVAFDNSKDRTFADWNFTNSGLMSAYLDAGQIPSMNAGQTFVDKKVTQKATEALAIDRSGRQTNLNLNAELTDAKVKQFAEATAANPVRYAWQRSDV